MLRRFYDYSTRPLTPLTYRLAIWVNHILGLIGLCAGLFLLTYNKDWPFGDYSFDHTTDINDSLSDAIARLVKTELRLFLAVGLFIGSASAFAGAIVLMTWVPTHLLLHAKRD
jgi:hypothetical protein